MVRTVGLGQGRILKTGPLEPESNMLTDIYFGLADVIGVSLLKLRQSF